MSEVVVKLSGVSKSYEKARVTALRCIDLEVTKGETIAVTGSSGSGKSTLLNLIGTLDTPSTGSIFLFENEITPQMDLRLFRREHIGFIFQLHHLLPYLTVLENVLLPLVPSDISRRERVERAQAVLDSVGLGKRLKHLPTELSGGERQRTAIARALVTDPLLIVADEPTGNLDRENSERLIELLLTLVRSDQRTLIMATHDTQVASRMDRRLSLADGELLTESQCVHG